MSFRYMNSWEQILVKIEWEFIFILENTFEIVVCQSGGHFVQWEMS